jgi:putative ABC transport system substrate-binding protein
MMGLICFLWPVASWPRLLRVPLVVLFAWYCLASCSGIPHQPGLVEQTKKPAAAKVLVINSDYGIPHYRTAEEGYLSAFRGPVTILHMDALSDDVRKVENLLFYNQFDVIYCIGTQALSMVLELEPDAAVVFSSVLNWQRFKLKNNHYGVASEVAPELQLALFQTFFPQIREIGILYSETNKSLVKLARKSAEKFAVNLNMQKVHAADELEEKLDQLLATSDAVWLIPDPVVLSSQANAQRLFEHSKQAQKPVLAYSDLYEKLGATLTISIDVPTVGRQAAILTMQLMEGGVVEPRIQYPAGTYISLNLSNVKQFNLQLNLGALDSVNQLVEDSSGE